MCEHLQIGNPILAEKYEILKDYLKGLGSVAIAFSGGVDSTFLLKTAHNLLGDCVIAVTAQSCSFPKRESEEAAAFCEKEGIRQIAFAFKELQIEGFCQNPANRCYLCKKELLGRIQEIASEHGIQYIAEGSNLDDNGDYRPGMQAVEELGIKSPLREAQLTKAEIRSLSRQLSLPVWDKPSFACLASRFVYGETITQEKLNMVERAEQLLLDMNFHQVRVRIHDKMARIEIMPEEFEKMMQNENRERVVRELKRFGFTYVSMDLAGYRTGSMNEVL